MLSKTISDPHTIEPMLIGQRDKPDGITPLPFVLINRMKRAKSIEWHLMTPREEVIHALSHGKPMKKQTLIAMTGRHHLAVRRAIWSLTETGHLEENIDDATVKLRTELTELDRHILNATKASIPGLTRDEICLSCRDIPTTRILRMTLSRLVGAGYLRELDSPPGEPHWLVRYRFVRDTPRVRVECGLSKTMEAAAAFPVGVSKEEKKPVVVAKRRSSKHLRLVQALGETLPSLGADLRCRMGEAKTLDKVTKPHLETLSELLNDLYEHRQAYGLLRDTTDAEVEQAEEKFRKLVTQQGIVSRTVRKYRALFDNAHSEFGNGLLGLLPKIKLRGNRSSRLPVDVLRIIDTALAEALENRWSKKTTYSCVRTACSEKNLATPSRAAFDLRYRRAMEAHGCAWEKFVIQKKVARRPTIETATLDSLATLTEDIEARRRYSSDSIKCSDEELAEAVRRFREMLPNQESNLAERTRRKYRKCFADAQAALGNGLIGLLPRRRLRGNRKPRLAADTLLAVNETITETRFNGWSPKEAYNHLLETCRKRSSCAPTYVAFKRRLSLSAPAPTLNTVRAQAG